MDPGEVNGLKGLLPCVFNFERVVDREGLRDVKRFGVDSLRGTMELDESSRRDSRRTSPFLVYGIVITGHLSRVSSRVKGTKDSP